MKTPPQYSTTMRLETVIIFGATALLIGVLWLLSLL